MATSTTSKYFIIENRKKTERTKGKLQELERQQRRCAGCATHKQFIYPEIDSKAINFSGFIFECSYQVILIE